MTSTIEYHVLADNVVVVFDMWNEELDFVCQLVTKARKLADEKGWKVTVILFGTENVEYFEELRAYGAEQILLFEREQKFISDEITNYMVGILEHMDNGVILFPATNSGKEVSAILSVKFELGLTADCIDIQCDKENGFIFSRAAIGDSVIADIICVKCNIYMCTVKKGVIIKHRYESELQFEVQKHICNEIFKVHKEMNRLGCIHEDRKENHNIEKYDIVFGIGRGVKRSETREKISMIARLYNACVVGTKATVDENWIDKDRQVGQSGKSIAPKIYICFGISGASQHIVGILNANKIIAVNNDENAWIFQYADYAIIDEVDNVINNMEKIILEEGILKRGKYQNVNFDNYNI